MAPHLDSLTGDASPRDPESSDHALTVIAGSPRERGRRYGQRFRTAIQAFLDRELYQAFTVQPPGRESVLRYAEACHRAIERFSPEIAEEMEGMAEGAQIQIEEMALLTLHEELWHQGVLPEVTKCTAFAAGPPDTVDGCAYVGQNWDWMPGVYGLSHVLLWQRSEGPSVLAYAYPGLWVSAGLNSAGVALCWTSGLGLGIAGPRIGIPSYVLIAQMLYQETLAAAIEEARRAQHAGWFTFLLADAEGTLVNVEGTPGALVIEAAQGHVARVYYGSRQMTDTPEGQAVAFHPQCQRMWDLLGREQGRLDRETLQGFFGDHASTICKHGSTLDSMLFDCARREACISRGPGCSGRWQTFRFEGETPGQR
ncbi:MAG: hypothetical protein IT210_00145 [Armatimonadetes bacterium]|nr:hypothetical protein [Armatimonadota bacterium]